MSTATSGQMTAAEFFDWVHRPENRDRHYELGRGRVVEMSRIPEGLIEGLRAFPLRREVEHCGQVVAVSAFEFYASCPQCATRIKVRSCSGIPEIEDVFDAVFEWMGRPGAQELVRRRQQVIAEDADEE